MGRAPVDPADCTEVKMVPFNSSQDIAKPFPTNWYTRIANGFTFDDRDGGVPDPGHPRPGHDPDRHRRRLPAGTLW